ncbi:hypothetical protein [Cupriavidus taiwanensis]|uniref:hypothetical protein n=1 Tax=Cupriavidus taiwanensis TaxID=164546 RepID=UPI000E10CFF2|nr:hypothetical protein [Cupriavidus taiwanensis]SOY56823.1 hypothetical protein CBM2592_A90118 [Cupriavidus taiwanensis]SOY90731.1 hypothetical protein CBM2591_A90117 [Cupriavidus taiwanensis]SOZ63530.1 hypothetical protein CBM2617_A70094 [Cupriavidus taiwanensis]SOZ82551.1 hypothetical protein CBM2618_A80095 [Cupriavidus taiwanensis]SOZ84415.1 hypothetical protein CBM2622_A80094 [Cupriavidus taiwanensis]
MNVRELYERIFNAEEMKKARPTEDMCVWVFAIGVQEGMRQAAKLLDGEWFKTQQECTDAIQRAASKL